MPDVVVNDKMIMVNVYKPMRGHLIIGDRVYSNLLTRNFTRILQRSLGGQILSITTTYGSSFDFNFTTSGATTRLRIGSGTTPPSYTDYNVPDPIADITPSVTITRLTDVNIIGISAYATQGFSTVGIVSNFLFNDGSASRWFDILLARSLASIGADQAFTYRITIPHPFNNNFANMLYGFLSNTNQQVANINGATYTMGSGTFSSEVNSSIVVTDSDIDDSISRGAVPGSILIPSVVEYYESNTSITIVVRASFTPSSTYTIRLIGISKSYPTPGNIVWLLKRLDQPVTLSPGETRMIMFRLVF